MLLSLPDELLRDIMPYDITFNDDCGTPEKRRSPTLRALSLVSQRFHGIAQPLLFKSISVKSVQQLKGVVDLMERPGWDGKIREVTIKDSQECGFRTELLERFLRKAGQGLRTLELSRTRGRLLSLSVLHVLPSTYRLSPLRP